jgi:hypothetical protein
MLARRARPGLLDSHLLQFPTRRRGDAVDILAPTILQTFGSWNPSKRELRQFAGIRFPGFFILVGDTPRYFKQY